jgi:hypothetical protein
MAEQLSVSKVDRDVLVQCVVDAYDAIHIIPGIDANGPVLTWLAGHLLQLHRANASPGSGPS